jgi:hypothetical protein
MKPLFLVHSPFFALSVQQDCLSGACWAWVRKSVADRRLQTVVAFLWLTNPHRQSLCHGIRLHVLTRKDGWIRWSAAAYLGIHLCIAVNPLTHQCALSSWWMHCSCDLHPLVVALSPATKPRAAFQRHLDFYTKIINSRHGGNT